MHHRLTTHIVLTLFFVLATTLPGEARTLEEILKDKGVITAEDYAEASKSTLVSYKPGKGISATSADGQSSLKIGGWAQFIYRYTDKDDPAKDNISDFDIRRFKLVFQGNLLSKNFGYKFQGDVSSGFRTEDAFVNYKVAAPLTLQAGQFKPPQARQELISAARQLFPERSLANDTFNLGRDQGLQASGSLADKRLEYRLGIFNGNGPNISNPDDNHMVAGRIDINPLGAVAFDEAGWTDDKPKLNLGASFAWEKISASDVGSGFDKDNDIMDVALNLDGLTATTFATAFGNDLSWLLWTANMDATWKGASFAAEYYRLNADPQSGNDWNASGYYLQAGYQILPKQLEIAARYSSIKSTDTQASAHFDKSETQLGVNYYFSAHTVKLQSDLTLVTDDWNPNQDDMIARLQFQFYF